MFSLLIIAAELERRKKIRIQRRRFRDLTNPFTMPEERFRELYKLTREVAQILLEEMHPHMVQGKRNIFIPIPIRLCVALNFFASGTYRRNIGIDVFGVISPRMAFRMVAEVTAVLQDKLCIKWIKFPQVEEYDVIKQRFFEETGFPGVIGVIDCTHVRIKKPDPDVAHCYLNSKGYYSKNVQWICDSNLRILGMFARFGGSTEDDYIWEGCQAKAALENRYEACEPTEYNSWLLGDSGYPLSPWLITPYTGSSEKDEQTFNTIHARTRNCVKKLDLVLKSVFRCLKLGLAVTPQVSGQLINACSVLHNFRIAHGITGDVPIEIDIDENEDVILADPESPSVYESAARVIRERLKADLCQ